MTLAASATTGFLVSVRWLLRRRAVVVVVVAAAAAFGLGWTLSDSGAGRRAAWIEFAMLFLPLVAIGVGAFGAQVLRPRHASTPVAAQPLAPAGWVLGQGAALVAAVLLATAVLLAPGLVFFSSGLSEARPASAAQLTGQVIDDHGRSWARAGEGALVWALPAPGDGRWEAVLPFDTAFYRGYRGGPIVVRVAGPGGLATRATVGSAAPLRVALPAAFSGGSLTLTCETDGVATTPRRDGAFLVSLEPGGGGSGWLALWWTVAAHGLLLGAVALAAAMLVSPPIALAAALTVWLVGWASRFLADYADASGLPSVFAAWSGAAAEPVGASVWLRAFAAVIRLVPDLSGDVVVGALGRDYLPEWGRVGAATAPHLAATAGLVLVAALIAAVTWKRSPGRIPGERGHF